MTRMQARRIFERVGFSYDPVRHQYSNRYAKISADIPWDAVVEAFIYSIQTGPWFDDHGDDW